MGDVMNKCKVFNAKGELSMRLVEVDEVFYSISDGKYMYSTNKCLINLENVETVYVWANDTIEGRRIYSVGLHNNSIRCASTFLDEVVQ